MRSFREVDLKKNPLISMGDYSSEHQKGFCKKGKQAAFSSLDASFD